MKPVPPDRLRDVVDAVLEALDDGLDGPALAAASSPPPRATSGSPRPTPSMFTRRAAFTCPASQGPRPWISPTASSSAIAGRDIPPRDARGVPALQARLAAVEPQFASLVRRIRDRNEWDDVFVDALCTPPVSFTFGSVIAHILTVGVVRRQAVIGALRELGVADVESRDPIEWERAIVSRG